MSVALADSAASRPSTPSRATIWMTPMRLPYIRASTATVIRPQAHGSASMNDSSENAAIPVRLPRMSSR